VQIVPAGKRRDDDIMSNHRRPNKLARASAYWRLAAKARKRGDSRSAEHWSNVGDRLYAQHQRETKKLSTVGETP
jgi:hypothetical protein